MQTPSRLLKRNPEPVKTITRPQTPAPEPTKPEPVKPEPVKDTGVGGSSLDNMVAACAVELMNARNSFHKLHLKVTGPGSYAAHKALNELYDQIPDFVDTLMDGYQGVSEKILMCKDLAPRTLEDVSDAISYLRDLYATINKLQGMMPYSEIVNNLDLVKDAINSTKYKLLFLK
jgi:DNA-binding ferritin-like protein